MHILLVSATTGHAENFTNSFNGTAPCVGDIALAFYSVLWAYDGWYTSTVLYSMNMYLLYIRNVLSYSVEESNNVEKYSGWHLKCI